MQNLNLEVITTYLYLLLNKLRINSSLMTTINTLFNFQFQDYLP